MSKETPKTQLALIDNEHEIIPSPEALQDAVAGLAELGDRLRISDLGNVSIAGGGAGTFKVREPGQDEAEGGVKTVEGVVIAHHPVNIRWAHPFSERADDERPACRSTDGVTGINAETGEAIACETCPYNQFGADGQRKECANKRQLYILRQGELFPVLMSLPPSALRAWRDYTVSCLIKSGVPVHRVVTRLTLKNQKNAQKIEYSVPVFTAAGRLSPQSAEYLRAFGESLAQRLQKAGLTADDEPASPAPEAPAGDQFVQVDDEEMPF